MQLSEHFSFEELTYSQTATRLGIDNTPLPAQVQALYVLAAGLERVRHLLGDIPLHVDSGYRSTALNAKIGGAPTSAHRLGYAADFICPQYGTPTDIARAIEKSDILFDQLICEGDWVHISFAPTMRNNVLTASFNGGKASYTQGLAS